MTGLKISFEIVHSLLFSLLTQLHLNSYINKNWEIDWSDNRRIYFSLDEQKR